MFPKCKFKWVCRQEVLFSSYFFFNSRALLSAISLALTSLDTSLTWFTREFKYVSCQSVKTVIANINNTWHIQSVGFTCCYVFGFGLVYSKPQMFRAFFYHQEGFHHCFSTTSSTTSTSREVLLLLDHNIMIINTSSIAVLTYKILCLVFVFLSPQFNTPV